MCLNFFVVVVFRLEVVAEPWMEGLWPALRKHLKLDLDDSTLLYSSKSDSNSSDTVDSSMVNGINTNNLTGLTNGLSHDQDNDSQSCDNASSVTGQVETISSHLLNVTLKEQRLEGANVEAGLSGESTGSVEASLNHSVTPLSESSLTLPLLPPAFIQVHYDKEYKFVSFIISYQNKTTV